MEFREDPAGRRRAVLDAASGLTKRVCNEIADYAYRGAPVDTGVMRDSIGVRSGLFGAHEVYVGGTDAPYWASVEYGHRIVDRDGHDTGESVPAQPFMRPAVAAVRATR